MKYKKPMNENYTGIAIKTQKSDFKELDNCDNVCHLNVFSNLVIVSKPKTEEDYNQIGVFFPVETKLSESFLHNNNLYRNSEFNKDRDKKGFFEKNGRIKAIKFRGNYSQGFFVPLTFFSYIKDFDINEFEVGDVFDYINDEKVCEKYIIKKKKKNNIKIKPIKKTNELEIKTGQFNFHIDTPQLYRSLSDIQKTDELHISQKVHGTSVIFSNVLVQKLSEKNIILKFLNKLGLRKKQYEYKKIYSSRRVIKNLYYNKESDKNDFYGNDVWGYVFEKIKEKLPKGITIYGEILGYLPDTETYIQKPYDYECQKGTCKLLVYRITMTNEDGFVHEFSMQQVENFCKSYGFEMVKTLEKCKAEKYWNKETDIIDLEKLVKKYINKKIYNTVGVELPDEGIVIRNESHYNITSYKFKSPDFYEFETKLLDVGEEDIETDN